MRYIALCRNGNSIRVGPETTTFDSKQEDSEQEVVVVGEESEP